MWAVSLQNIQSKERPALEDGQGNYQHLHRRPDFPISCITNDQKGREKNQKSDGEEDVKLESLSFQTALDSQGRRTRFNNT